MMAPNGPESEELVSKIVVVTAVLPALIEATLAKEIELHKQSHKTVPIIIVRIGLLLLWQWLIERLP